MDPLTTVNAALIVTAKVLEIAQKIHEAKNATPDDLASIEAYMEELQGISNTVADDLRQIPPDT